MLKDTNKIAAVVGLVSSLITLFTFATGLQSLSQTFNLLPKPSSTSVFISTPATLPTPSPANSAGQSILPIPISILSGIGFILIVAIALLILRVLWMKTVVRIAVMYALLASIYTVILMFAGLCIGALLTQQESGAVNGGITGGVFALSTIVELWMWKQKGAALISLVYSSMATLVLIISGLFVGTLLTQQQGGELSGGVIGSLVALLLSPWLFDVAPMITEKIIRDN